MALKKFRIAITKDPALDDYDLLEITDITVTSEAPGRAISDTSGSVGTISITTPDIGPVDLADVEGAYYSAAISDGGIQWGIFTGSTYSDETRTATLTGLGYLFTVLAYNVTAEPYQGTLAGAIAYYGTLAATPVEIVLFEEDPQYATPVVFPGWTGELWVVLKEIFITFGLTPIIGHADWGSTVGPYVALWSNPFADYEEPADPHLLTHNRQTDSSTLAQKVELTRLNPKWVTNSLVYPPGGWTPEVNVLSVGPQETQEYTLELDTSITSFTQPTMVTYVSSTHSSSSRYTIVGDDGFPIQPAQWTDYGGKLTVKRGDDTKSLVVTLKGPDKDIIMSNGRPCSTYSVALASDTSGSRYSTLRIIGTGARLRPETVEFGTGVTKEQTGTDLGASVDGRFIQSAEQLYRQGSLCAATFGGGVLTGNTAGSDYSGFTDLDESEWYFPGLSRKINGRRWRITSVTYTPGAVSQLLSDGITYGDLQASQNGKTYTQVKADNTDSTYTAVRLRGTH